ncbi:MAG: septal ring lytic transglycosylase RlpA family protein [Flavobacteriia bacterium]|nr:septal ring lytic transglycosylase RlpA family protein [Flavobacteriia bacterium]
MRLLLFSFFIVSLQKVPLEYQKEGYASYYANKFEGRRTASGEIYRSSLFTAAHKKLPFGTFVKVVNLKNDSTVVVKINDRLGKSSPHLIDLSLIAAKKLNFIKSGKTKVSLEIQSNDSLQ